MPETLARTRPARGEVEEHEAAPQQRRQGLPVWVKGLAPLLLLLVLVLALFRMGPIGVLRESFPPVEELTVQRIAFPHEGEMRVRVVNGGPEPVTIAQVLVDDAAWVHTLDGDRTVGRLESREITIPYPWVSGEPHTVKLLTSTGLTFERTADVATRTPTPDARYLATFALLGAYVGVIPVFLGLLWLPFMRAISRSWVDFFLALTIGLLVFLGVDALIASLASARLVAGAFQGTSLVLIGALGTPLAIHALGQLGGRRRAESAWGVAMLIACAIGLHNLGEGLAIGAAYASGAIALGTTLVLGFLVHNTTEGLGIVAPLAEQRTSLGQLVLLGTIAGVPTIFGAWIGGFTYSPLLTTLFLAVGAGAIAQVVYVIGRRLVRDAQAVRLSPLNTAGFLTGLLIMYMTGLLVAA
jgi:ZIP family zinc transporter